MREENLTAKDLNDDVQKLYICIFSRKHIRTSHPELLFNNNPVHKILSQKHLGMILDSKPNFEEHLETIFTEVKITIGLLRKLEEILPRKSFLTIYKSFIRPQIIPH